MSSFFDEASLVFIPSGYKTSKAYSVKPTSGDGDLTFTRSNDTATRVGPDGLIEKVRTNLALYSEDATQADWVKTTLAVTGNTTTAPDGTLTADTLDDQSTVGYGRLSQAFTFQDAEYTWSFFIKKTTGALTHYAGAEIGDLGEYLIIDTTNGTGVQALGTSYTYNIVSYDSNWWRVSLTATITAGNKSCQVWPAISSNGTSIANTATGSNVFWGFQFETGVMTDYIATTSSAVSVGPVANVPRLDYAPTLGQSGVSCPRLLLEPQRTNLALYSEQFDNVYWGKVGTLTANAGTSPDGYINADKLASGTSNYITKTFTTTIGVAYTASVYIKSANAGQSASLRFNLSAGQAVPAISTPVITTDEWQRVTAVFTATTTSTFFQIGEWATFGYGPTNDILIWGAQLEQGSYATSYCPTLGAAVTRGADAASKTGISSLIGQTEGTLFVELSNTHTPTDTERIMTISDGSGSNRISISRSVTGFEFYAFVIVGGVNVAQINLSSYPTGIAKAAFAYKANDFVFYVNGTQVGADTSGSVPSCSQLDLGQFLSVNYLGDSINQALLFKTRLTNAQLAELTA